MLTMKTKLALTTLIVLLLGAGTAQATSTSQTLIYKGILCRPDPATHSVMCLPLTGEGYGVGINRLFVIVVNLATGKRVSSYLQP